MTDANKVVSLASYSERSVVDTLKKFLKDEDILTSFEDDDVELEFPGIDEHMLDRLTYPEKQLFIIEQLCNSLIRSELVEVEAASAEHISKVMRKHGASYAEVMTKHVDEVSSSISSDQLILLNTLGSVVNMAGSLYAFSVRHRNHVWDKMLIVRHGFVVYTYS